MDIKEFIAGTIGGGFGTLLSHPFDTIRIKLQTETNKNLLQIIKENKIKNLYQGLSPPLFGISLEKAVVFGTYYNLEKNPILNNKYDGIFNGFIAGFISTLVVTPVERFKIALQTNQSIKNIKLNSLFNGWYATIFRESPGYAIYFQTYQYLKNYQDKPFINGCLAGSNAWLFIYPSDRIKTLVQNNNQSYKNTIKQIYFNEGIKGFYRGFSLALLRCIPLHGGVFYGYEFIKKYL